MGGRGTYSVGKNVAYTYRTSEFIEGIKVLRPIDKENPSSCRTNPIRQETGMLFLTRAAYSVNTGSMMIIIR